MLPFLETFCANLEYVYTLRQKSISEILTVDPLKKMKSLNVCQRCNSNERDRMYINNLVVGFLKNIYKGAENNYWVSNRSSPQYFVNVNLVGTDRSQMFPIGF